MCSAADNISVYVAQLFLRSFFEAFVRPVRLHVVLSYPVLLRIQRRSLESSDMDKESLSGSTTERDRLSSGFK